MYSNGLKGKNKNIVILTEFMEGAWESAIFSHRNLINSNHGVVFVQTYSKPRYGQSLLKNFVPVMKQIVRNELLELKLKAVNEFKFEESRVSIRPFEGDWFSFLNGGQKSLSPELLVVSLKKAFPGVCCPIIGKIQKLAEQTTNPLLILPASFAPAKLKSILFLTSKELSFLRKLDECESVSTLLQKSETDLRILLDKNTAPPVDWNSYVSNQWGAALKSNEAVPFEKVHQLLKDTYKYDLVIVDQELLKSPFGKALNLKKWFRNKYSKPVLIC
ncbi:hypothetical protein INQ51_16195 [Maribellus sp. CM-23]|uniref:hypothetical protein n=1 Tax=Maribellus sp. CM-23 TaxID=2781026 RepID=UPI001F166FB4|nr:hypothetical protein [Maribellus sp. CM-23]MCE4565861.1 hypothetical protein [Maribellus sp. CM-23]